MALTTSVLCVLLLCSFLQAVGFPLHLMSPCGRLKPKTAASHLGSLCPWRAGLDMDTVPVIGWGSGSYERGETLLNNGKLSNSDWRPSLYSSRAGALFLRHPSTRPWDEGEDVGPMKYCLHAGKPAKKEKTRSLGTTHRIKHGGLSLDFFVP